MITKQEKTIKQVKHDNIMHSFAVEECIALIDFINAKLSADGSLVTTALR